MQDSRADGAMHMRSAIGSAVFLSSLVSLSFACELYFKSLLSNGESSSYGHDLSEFFSQFKGEVKEMILSHPEFKGDDGFHQKLEISKNIFKDWCYAFEPKEKEVDIVFLERLSQVLHDVAEKGINTN